jgi:hypothetical protein
LPKTPKEQSFTDQITDNKHNARQYAPVTEGSGMKGSFGGWGIRKAAQRRAAVRRFNLEAMSLYGGKIRAKFRLSAGCSQIAVPGGGPAMRGGLRPWFRAWCATQMPPTRSNLPLGTCRQAQDTGINQAGALSNVGNFDITPRTAQRWHGPRHARRGLFLSGSGCAPRVARGDPAISGQAHRPALPEKRPPKAHA